jgi:hypothetical protein
LKPSLELVASPANSEMALSVLCLGAVARSLGNDEYFKEFGWDF